MLSQRLQGVPGDQRTKGKDNVLRRKNARLLRVLRQFVQEQGITPKELIREVFSDAIEKRVVGMQPGHLIEQVIRDEVGRKLGQWHAPQGSGVTKLNELIERVIREEATRLLRENLAIKIDLSGSVDHEGRGIDERRMRDGAMF